MRSQEVKIQKYVDSEAEGRPILFKGTKNELRTKLEQLQYQANKKLNNTKVYILENREKHKKLGMGLTISCSDNKGTGIEYITFWPISLNKPIHIK